jgi:hypothetical protein
MATITTGVAKNFRMGNFTAAETAAFWGGWTDVVRSKGGFLDHCNVSITGSTRPMTYIGTCYDASVWAWSYPRGWGTGSTYFSTHPSVIASWRKYGVDTIARKLFTHECSWHLWANTYDQSGNWPITPAMCSRWWQHWPRQAGPRGWFQELNLPVEENAKLSWRDKLGEFQMRFYRDRIGTPLGSLDCEK